MPPDAKSRMTKCDITIWCYNCFNLFSALQKISILSNYPPHFKVFFQPALNVSTKLLCVLCRHQTLELVRI